MGRGNWFKNSGVDGYEVMKRSIDGKVATILKGSHRKELLSFRCSNPMLPQVSIMILFST
jgi:hypothetical protein